jgi:hypothetical protein
MAHRSPLLRSDVRRLASLSHRSVAERAVREGIPHHVSLHLSCQWVVVQEETLRQLPTPLLVMLGPSLMAPAQRSDADLTVETPVLTKVCPAKTASRRHRSEVCSRPIRTDSYLLGNDDLTMVSLML